MNEVFGWRGKIGLIVNSGQIITEPLFNRLSPDGVSFYASRVLVEGGVIENHEFMEKEAFRAGRELATADVECIAFCCTMSSILRGVEGDREFCLRMEKQNGIPTTSTLAATIESLNLFHIKRIVLISPYEHESHALEEEFFNANGFQVVKSGSMDIPSRKKRTSTTPGEIFQFCRENWDDRADGLYISCMNFNAMPCIGALEKDLRKPVLSSHASTLWKVLRMVNMRQPIDGYGRLFAGR